MNNPKISVIVPVYKAENFLSICVNSILSQTFTDFELILVEDGSPDRSGAICDDYAKQDARVKALHKMNGGVSSARNMGIESASGEYLSFVDADDCVDETWLESYDFNSDCDFQVLGYRMVNEHGIVRQICLTDAQYTQSEYYGLIFTVSHYVQLTLFASPFPKLYKNSLIRQSRLRFREGVHLGEDFMFNLDYFLLCKRMRVISTIAYNYHIENSVLSQRRYSTEKYIEWNNSFQPTMDRIKVVNSKAADYILCTRITCVLRAAFRQKGVERESKGKAINYYKKHRTKKTDQFLRFPYMLVRWVRWLPEAVSVTLLSFIFWMLRPFSRSY